MTTKSMHCKLEDLLDGPLQHVCFEELFENTNGGKLVASRHLLPKQPENEDFIKTCFRLPGRNSGIVPNNRNATLLDILSSTKQNLGVGAVSFWSRLMLILVQCATGRLTEPQSQSVAESVLRAASNNTTSNNNTPESFLHHLHEIASNTITFSLWAASTTTTSSQQQENNEGEVVISNMTDGSNITASTVLDNNLGVLDVEKESNHVEAILRFLEQKEDSSPLLTMMMSNNNNNSNKQSQNQQQLHDDGELSENNNNNNNNNNNRDFIIQSLVSLFALPSTYRELLPKMKQATNNKKKDEDERGGGKSSVNEPLPDSDDEPEDEEQRRRLEERRNMERQQQRAATNNNHNDDDASGEYITVDSDASYVCVKCGSVPRIPVQCFFCHQIFCARGYPPELSEHSIKCAGGCGLFMQMKVTQPLVLETGKRAQIEPSMFLDRFGEEDVSLRRGRPLMLNEERYRNFLRMAVRCSWDHHTAMLEDGGTWKSIQAL
jgi:hypothetical protein